MRIHTCGRVVVTLDGVRVEDDLPGRQGRLLFVYLVLHRARRVSRDELAAAIWPDEPPAAQESALSALLSKLRRVLGPQTVSRGAEVGLQFDAEPWVDLDAAADALHRAESAAARSEWTGVWGPARVTQHIAARGLLPGEDAPWIVEERRRIEEMHVRALELVSAASLEIGGAELDTAERAARVLVRCAPYRETGYRALMEVLTRRENPAEALVVYDRLRSLLRDELGAVPSRATQELHRRLLTAG